MFAWLRGWAATLHIMIFERETYRFLRDYEFSEGDFVKAPRPGCPRGCTSPFCDCPGTR